MGGTKSNLGDLIAYLAENYPHKSELSKARITKMMYLADWEAVKKTGAQLSDVRWYFHNYGPYVDDVVRAARQDSRMAVLREQNYYGDPKETVAYKGSGGEGAKLSVSEKTILDKVISETKSFYWDDFIRHVYSTPPISKSSRHSTLDLTQFTKFDEETQSAKQYQIK